MIDWLIDAFDPKKFPWFRDEFIHPNELPKEYRGAPLVNLFEGFSGHESTKPTSDESKRCVQRRVNLKLEAAATPSPCSSATPPAPPAHISWCASRSPYRRASAAIAPLVCRKARPVLRASRFFARAPMPP